MKVMGERKGNWEREGSADRKAMEHNRLVMCSYGPLNVRELG